MAETATAPASGTSSTPPAATAAAAASATSTTTPPAAATAAATTTSTTTTEPLKSADPAQAADPAKTGATTTSTTTAPDPLAWTMPEDFKPPETTVTKFMAAIQAATKDGKFEVTPQMMVDTYVDLARDANTAWQKQIETLDQTNKATCQSRFTPEQLAASESAVGWFSSYEPAFGEFAKRQLNDPVFVNAMRLVGEALQEEEFIPAAPPGPGKKTPAEIMGYTKKQ